MIILRQKQYTMIKRGVINVLDISERLKKLRTDNGMSQEELGKVVGLDKSSISAYEKGQNSPSLETICGFAEYFKTTTDYILGRDPRYVLDITDLPPKLRSSIQAFLVQFGLLPPESKIYESINFLNNESKDEP